jgi:hypothetical protein
MGKVSQEERRRQVVHHKQEVSNTRTWSCAHSAMQTMAVCKSLQKRHVVGLAAVALIWLGTHQHSHA